MNKTLVRSSNVKASLDGCHLDSRRPRAGLEPPSADRLSLRVNDIAYAVPLPTDATVRSAAVETAAIVTALGGFAAEANPAFMIGQLQIVGIVDLYATAARLADAEDVILSAANSFAAKWTKSRMRAIEVTMQPLHTSHGPMLLAHVLVDVGDAVGTDAVDAMMEFLAPVMDSLSGGRVRVRGASELADQRLAQARVALPLGAIAADPAQGAELAARIVNGWGLADANPHRAATQNRNVLRAIGVVAAAYGNDPYQLDAGAHSYAARTGRYCPLTQWEVSEGALLGSIELPVAAGMPSCRVGDGSIGSARELAFVLAAVGLNQDLAMMRAMVARETPLISLRADGPTRRPQSRGSLAAAGSIA